MRGMERGTWSVGGHLAAIAVAVTLVFIAVGGVLGQQAWQHADERGHADARHLAEFAAGMTADSGAVALEQVGQLAVNPGAPPLLADPAGCTLNLTLALLPHSHLDLVKPDGTVACSSAELPAAGVTHPQAAWSSVRSSGQAGITAPFFDGVTGERAVAFVALIKDQAQVIGSVAVVAPMAGIAGAIADSGATDADAEFTILDTATGAVLSTSLDSAVSDTDPLPGYLTELQAIPGTPWTLAAGIESGAAMAATRSMLLRGLLLGACVLVVMIGSILVVNRRIARPLRALTHAVGGPSQRLSTALASIEGPSEVRELGAKFEAALAERDAYEFQLAHQALHDPLTGLPNRALLLERLNDALERSGHHDADFAVAVLFIDLDRFKLINDSLGHDVGDTVLLEVARRISTAIPEGATLSRFGGDEFVVIAETAGDSQVQRLVDDVIAAVSAPIQTAATVVRVTASIGIATGTAGRRPADLIRDADNAMYAAKERGRDRAERFSRQLHDRAAEHLTLATEFRAALDRGELYVAYQPKIELAGGRIVGVEALLRWNHPALGSVPPSTFIPIAEETDAIIRVGQFVLEEACQAAMDWRRAGLEISVAVNVSGRQLTDGNLPLHVETALALVGSSRRGPLPRTDRNAAHDRHPRVTAHASNSFTRSVCSSASTTSVPATRRSPTSIASPSTSSRSTAPSSATSTRQATRAPLVAAMIAMGKALDLKIVAEGVETPEQAARLRELGCDHAQGYLFARPQAPGELVEYGRQVLTSS